MAQSFTFTVPGDPAAAFDKARSEIAAAGGSLSGDAGAGTFTGPTPMGTVKGSYSVSGDAVTVTITEKPWLVPAGMIETKVREYFGAT